MNLLRQWAKSKVAQALGLGLASALLVLGAVRVGGFETVERKSLDWRIRALTPRGLASRDIVIVALDDSSFSSQDMLDNFGRWPWRRKLYAGLVHFLNECGAKVIGLDLIFQVADPHEGDDAQLVQALAERPNAVLAFALNMGTFREKDESARVRLRQRLEPFALQLNSQVPLVLKRYSGVDLSKDEFLKAAPHAGCITVQSDSDGPVRTATPLFLYGDRNYPSFSMAIAARARGEKPDVSVAPGPRLRFAGHDAPLDSQGRLLIRWYGPAYRTYKHYSVWQVFNSALAYYDDRKPDIAPETFKGKIVLIGPTAASASDLLSNPFSESYPGVEVHATLIDNLLRGDFLRAADAR